MRRKRVLDDLYSYFIPYRPSVYSVSYCCGGALH